MICEKKKKTIVLKPYAFNANSLKFNLTFNVMLIDFMVDHFLFP